MRCDWCPGWAWNPYVIDAGADNLSLCDVCWDRLFDEGGGPPPPTAVCHRTNALRMLLPQLAPVARHIATFLEDWHRPGRGSQ